MFGVGKKNDKNNVSKNQQADMKFGRDFEKAGESMDFPLKKEMSQEPMPNIPTQNMLSDKLSEAPAPMQTPAPQESQPQAKPFVPPAANNNPVSISPIPDPVGNLELPPLPETDISEAKHVKEESLKNIPVSQM
ncbi:MAG: hypothetical protein KAI53_05175, partial [Candidatus Aenigmarchaeota archaeon]|nr:hypothetical protein [Candidatus Aenigmarchaeota archaeon]